MKPSNKNYNHQKKSKPMRSELYWRYKKKTPPQDENPELNGPVVIKKPKKEG